jgi:precorrin-6Y C5,15-methyltransferase (decarboxylating)
MVSKVYVIGMGMGNPDTLTVEARSALDRSDLIIGSSRLLEALGERDARMVALVASARIAEELREAPEAVASVVMSGDVGFYSGATSLYPLLEGLDVEVIPGISSLAYLCARLRCTWQDAFVVSAHGRAHNLAGAVQTHAKTFVLTGGSARAGELCTLLVERGLGDVRVQVGERLSYDDERITAGTASELAGRPFESLAVMLVLNDAPITPDVRAPHLRDDAFVRGEVPMTKEEVRALAVCKLRVRPDDTVWDVGAGTGSVSVELAQAACAGQVFAIERTERACALIEANRQEHGLTNLRIIAGEAPAALAGLPAPDRVFVGGSSGALVEIVSAALTANPAVRVCIAAVTLETVSDALACVRSLSLRDVDIIQLGVAKARELGRYHLMQASNPVYLVTACGSTTDEGQACR